MAEDLRKAELTAELARARARLSGSLDALRHDLDFPGRVKATVRKHPVTWIGGAALCGILLSILPGRRKKVVSNRDGPPVKLAGAGGTGLLLGALKIAFDLARPALTRWAAQRVADSMDGTKKNGRTPR